MHKALKIIVFVGAAAMIVLLMFWHQTSTFLFIQTSPTTALKSDEQVFPPSTKDNTSFAMAHAPLTKANTSVTMATGHDFYITKKDIFGQWKARNLQDENLNIKPTPGGVKYAVFSASTPENLENENSYNYVFDLPLTVMAWQRIGFRSIVFITGAESKWQTFPVLKLVYSYLKDLEARVVFIDGKPENLVTLSQISRLLACCVNDLNPEDYLITSDSDLWPINADKYELPPGKSLLSTFAFCCGYFNFKGKRYRMLPLANIGARVSTWREIMFGKHKVCLNLTSAAILDYFAKDFGSLVYDKARKGENNLWYLDQHMASVRIEQWIQIYNDTSIVEFGARLPGDRLDRSFWRPKAVGRLMDTHLLNFLYKTDEWRKVQPVLIVLYGEGTTYFSLCQRYHEDFVAEISLLKTTSQ